MVNPGFGMRSKSWQSTPDPDVYHSANNLTLSDEQIIWCCPDYVIADYYKWGQDYKNLRISIECGIIILSFQTLKKDQFSSVNQSCPTLCNPMNRSMPGLPVHHQPTPGVHTNPCPSSRWCHPTTSSSVVPFSSCLQSFPASESFKWVSSSHQVAKVLEFQLQHQSFQWTPRTDLL